MTALPSLDELKRRRNAMRRVLGELSDDLLAELRRRAGESNRELEDGAGGLLRDGFGRGGGESVSGGSVARPTEQAAIAELLDDPHGDPVRESISELFSRMGDACGALLAVDRKRRYVLAAGDAARGRQSTVGACARCDRTVTGVGSDRVKSGYCPACYQAWLRTDSGSGRMDRVAFERSCERAS